jgi:hypothetical protein
MSTFQLTSESEIKTGALFSEFREWRYSLWRIWNSEKPTIAFIGLNPSTADETQNDPTVRRCIGFAKAWDYGGMYMLNLFGLRSTDPKLLYEHDAPLGEQNIETIANVCEFVSKIVLCWGNHGAYLNQGRLLVRVLRGLGYGDKLWAFGITKRQQPKHPLYLAKDTKLIKV